MNNAVSLRKVIANDLPLFFEHQRDPHATRMAALPSRDHDAFMAHWARILADETIIINTVLFDGQVAGNILTFLYNGRREVGYWLGREFWGRGIATRALSAFLGDVESRPLYARVAKHNLASLQVLQKCGFHVIGEALGPSDQPGETVEDFVLELAAGQNSPEG